MFACSYYDYGFSWLLSARNFNKEENYFGHLTVYYQLDTDCSHDVLKCLQRSLIFYNEINFQKFKCSKYYLVDANFMVSLLERIICFGVLY